MEELAARYARLVGRWASGADDAEGLAFLARDAAALAASADDTWHRVMALGLAAAARARAGLGVDVPAMVDAAAPTADPAAPGRLDALLPGPGSLSERLREHEAATTLPPEAVAPVASDLVRLFHDRAADDLDLPPGTEPPTVELGAGPRRPSLHDDRLRLSDNRRWTAGDLLLAVREAAVPGGSLAARLRPERPSWRPSPATTVEQGLWAVGPEVLLGDHELAHELGRIGRRAGVRWSGDLIVAVRRALDDLAPHRAAAALEPDGARARLQGLGFSDEEAARLAARWTDPFARADVLARAAGPPLIRGWLVRVGQTAGLRRLLTEHLTPAELRPDDAGG